MVIGVAFTHCHPASRREDRILEFRHQKWASAEALETNALCSPARRNRLCQVEAAVTTRRPGQGACLPFVQEGGPRSRKRPCSGTEIEEDDKKKCSPRY